MAETQWLAYLGSHIKAKVGDVIWVPGMNVTGEIVGLEPDEVKIAWPQENPTGRWVLSFSGACLAYLPAEFLRARPGDGPIDHTRHQISRLFPLVVQP